ncbi:c-type cytochrome [Arcticibacter eurypsychrophilus]|uniref:c-type cytochrome n=1 Tax=Arcticibacter eurypsychrophilus TaxID=1434752 RepID=UPI00084D170F|nr:c-type cytochrome [Arcticibacter eurypsychrophilus]
MKKLTILSVLVLFITIIASCGGSNNSGTTSDSIANADGAASKEEGTENPSYDPNRGEGKFSSVDLGTSLDAAKAESGDKVYLVKCGACHKLTDEKLVGPGWAGVTTRHAPEWIMNFITNTDAMIDKDPKVQAQLELCLVRMPNQNLSDDDARNLLEFMRKNDGVK